MKLIYISNTRVPTEKANGYQSFQMCQSFAKVCEIVEFWTPNRRNLSEFQNLDPFEFYKVEKTFSHKKIACVDIPAIENMNDKIWFKLLVGSFGLSLATKLLFEQKSIIYIRDFISMMILSKLKKLNLIKHIIVFEAHTFSEQLANSLNGVDFLITINSHLKNLFEKYSHLKGKILVSHDGVNLEQFKIIDEVVAKNSLNLEFDKKYLTYVGRFNTQGNEKGIPEILEAFSYIQNSQKNANLMFVGGPMSDVIKYNEIMNRFNIDKNRVLFFDRQPVYELFKYYGASTVLLMPFPNTTHYAYYMSPLKMFEYMASCKVIIASNLPSIKDVLDENMALFCEPDNPKSLAIQMEKALNEDVSQMAKNAYNAVFKYSWDNRAKEIVEFIKNYAN